MTLLTAVRITEMDLYKQLLRLFRLSMEFAATDPISNGSLQAELPVLHEAGFPILDTVLMLSAIF